MVIKLLSIQIPQFWDLIKFTVQRVEGIGIDKTEAQFNNLLASLLNDRSQCFVKYSPEGEVSGLVITEIHEDYITKHRRLRVRCMYSVQITTTAEWEEGVNLIKEFARKNNCEEIFLETPHFRIMDILETLGFYKSHTVLNCKLEGD